MHRPGCNSEQMEPTDFLCDFCTRDWSAAQPMVEGHHGSLICGSCLRVAYGQLVTLGDGDAPEGWTCSLCLEHREEPAWTSPLRPEAVICRRCAKQAAGRLHADPESGWTRPDAG